MLKFKRKTLMRFSGVIWLIVGGGLSSLGARFLYRSIVEEGTQVSLLLGAFLFLCLCIGVLKGRFVLRKSAGRLIKRLNEFPEPVLIFHMYSPPYYLLLAGMILLGVSFKYLGLSYIVRGGVDVAVGSALITGAWTYFKE